MLPQDTGLGRLKPDFKMSLLKLCAFLVLPTVSEMEGRERESKAR